MNGPSLKTADLQSFFYEKHFAKCNRCVLAKGSVGILILVNIEKNELIFVLTRIKTYEITMANLDAAIFFLMQGHLYHEETT